MSEPYSDKDFMTDDSEPTRRTSDRWPYEFADYPLPEQITVVSRRLTRKGMIEEILSQCGLDDEEIEIRDDSKLTKDELAAIYLTIEGINNVTR